MKAKQNLEMLNEFETLIISSPNCDDTVAICALDKLRFCVFRDTSPVLAGNKLHNARGYSAIHRDIEFEGKIYVVANDNHSNQSTLFSIEENGKSLQITPLKRKELEHNEDLVR